MSGYTPLFSSIIASTIWRESKETKILWITMLAMSDARGIIEASIPGLADMAKITLDECKASLAILMAPDEYSRTKDHDGRRIQEVDGGWQLLNHEKFRDKARNRADYMREYRSRNQDVTTCNQNVTNVTTCNHPLPPVTHGSPQTHTHTQTREDYTYTLDDCVKASEGIGMRQSDIEAFWANYAAVNWIDAAGRKITNIKAALSKWKAKQPSYGKKFNEPIPISPDPIILDYAKQLYIQIKQKVPTANLLRGISDKIGQEKLNAVKRKVDMWLNNKGSFERECA